MSTIKTTYLQHPSSSSPNLTLASDGSVSGGAGLGGLVHIATESFSGVSSVSLDNVFTSTYDNYRIVVAADFAAGTAYLRLRISGTDKSSSTYRRTLASYSTAGAGPVVEAANSATGVTLTFTGATTAKTTVDVFSPYINGKTWFSFQGAADGSNQNVVHGAGDQTETIQCDGFTLLNTANFTGSLSVYGYANS